MINILGIDASFLTAVMSAVKTTAKSQHPSRGPVLTGRVSNFQGLNS